MHYHLHHRQLQDAESTFMAYIDSGCPSNYYEDEEEAEIGDPCMEAYMHVNQKWKLEILLAMHGEDETERARMFAAMMKDGAVAMPL